MNPFAEAILIWAVMICVFMFVMWIGNIWIVGAEINDVDTE